MAKIDIALNVLRNSSSDEYLKDCERAYEALLTFDDTDLLLAFCSKDFLQFYKDSISQQDDLSIRNFFIGKIGNLLIKVWIYISAGGDIEGSMKVESRSDAKRMMEDFIDVTTELFKCFSLGAIGKNSSLDSQQHFEDDFESMNAFCEPLTYLLRSYNSETDQNLRIWSSCLLGIDSKGSYSVINGLDYSLKDRAINLLPLVKIVLKTLLENPYEIITRSKHFLSYENNSVLLVNEIMKSLLKEIPLYWDALVLLEAPESKAKSFLTALDQTDPTKVTRMAGESPVAVLPLVTEWVEMTLVPMFESTVRPWEVKNLIEDLIVLTQPACMINTRTQISGLLLQRLFYLLEIPNTSLLTSNEGEDAVGELETWALLLLRYLPRENSHTDSRFPYFLRLFRILSKSNTTEQVISRLLTEFSLILLSCEMQDSSSPGSDSSSLVSLLLTDTWLESQLDKNHEEKSFFPLFVTAFSQSSTKIIQHFTVSIVHSFSKGVLEKGEPSEPTPSEDLLDQNVEVQLEVSEEEKDCGRKGIQGNSLFHPWNMFHDLLWHQTLTQWEREQNSGKIAIECPSFMVVLRNFMGLITHLVHFITSTTSFVRRIQRNPLGAVTQHSWFNGLELCCRILLPSLSTRVRPVSALETPLNMPELLLSRHQATVQPLREDLLNLLHNTLLTSIGRGTNESASASGAQKGRPGFVASVLELGMEVWLSTCAAKFAEISSAIASTSNPDWDDDGFMAFSNTTKTKTTPAGKTGQTTPLPPLVQAILDYLEDQVYRSDLRENHWLLLSATAAQGFLGTKEGIGANADPSEFLSTQLFALKQMFRLARSAVELMRVPGSRPGVDKIARSVVLSVGTLLRRLERDLSWSALLSAAVTNVYRSSGAADLTTALDLIQSKKETEKDYKWVSNASVLCEAVVRVNKRISSLPGLQQEVKMPAQMFTWAQLKEDVQALLPVDEFQLERGADFNPRRLQLMYSPFWAENPSLVAPLHFGITSSATAQTEGKGGATSTAGLNSDLALLDFSTPVASDVVKNFDLMDLSVEEDKALSAVGTSEPKKTELNFKNRTHYFKYLFAGMNRDSFQRKDGGVIIHGLFGRCEKGKKNEDWQFSPADVLAAMDDVISSHDPFDPVSESLSTTSPLLSTKEKFALVRASFGEEEMKSASTLENLSAFQTSLLEEQLLRGAGLSPGEKRWEQLTGSSDVLTVLVAHVVIPSGEDASAAVCEVIVRVFNSSGFRIPVFSLHLLPSIKPIMGRNDLLSNVSGGPGVLDFSSVLSLDGVEYFPPDSYLERVFHFSVPRFSPVDLVCRVAYQDLIYDTHDMFEIPSEHKSGLPAVGRNVQQGFRDTKSGHYLDEFRGSGATNKWTAVVDCGKVLHISVASMLLPYGNGVFSALKYWRGLGSSSTRFGERRKGGIPLAVHEEQWERLGCKWEIVNKVKGMVCVESGKYKNNLSGFEVNQSLSEKDNDQFLHPAVLQMAISTLLNTTIQRAVTLRRVNQGIVLGMDSKVDGTPSYTLINPLKKDPSNPVPFPSYLAAWSFETYWGDEVSVRLLLDVKEDGVSRVDGELEQWNGKVITRCSDRVAFGAVKDDVECFIDSIGAGFFGLV